MESLHDLKEHPSAISAKWVDALSGPPGTVLPALTTKRNIIRPSHCLGPTRKTIYPNVSGRPRSGAVLANLQGESIDSVSASWTGPNVFPPASAWNNASNNWSDGQW